MHFLWRRLGRSRARRVLHRRCRQSQKPVVREDLCIPRRKCVAEDGAELPIICDTKCGGQSRYEDFLPIVASTVIFTTTGDATVLDGESLVSPDGDPRHSLLARVTVGFFGGSALGALTGGIAVPLGIALARFFRVVEASVNPRMISREHDEVKYKEDNVVTLMASFLIMPASAWCSGLCSLGLIGFGGYEDIFSLMYGIGRMNAIGLALLSTAVASRLHSGDI
mmetsp:Transcript_3210/g.7471  ORF Transcript_3210/g.7471 Transcript_3210/m.7471 type:complete len:224 (-) Transcript_3210:56-727(-)